MIQLPEGFDSMFRYITVVAQRAEQLITGAKPRSDSRHKKYTLIARDEVEAGLVSWRILTPEELEAQRQAMVEQFRTEVGAEVAPRPVRDVLPTAEVLETAEEPPQEGEERDDELTRLQRLLGIAGGPEPETEETADAAAVSYDAESYEDDEDEGGYDEGDEASLDLDEGELEDYGGDTDEEE